MSRLALMVAAALTTAAAQPAVAAPAARHAVASEDAAWQQGKGQGGGQGGGGQEERGGRGQGGGGQEARESRGRSGGGEARPARQSGEGRGQAARGSSERRERSGNASAGRSSGNGGSASSSSGRSSGNASGSANERAKGSSSGAARSESRGNAGNADARRGERSSNDNASSSAGERRNGNAASGARGPHRLSGGDLQSRIAALPAAQRRLATSNRAAERVAVGAIARGHARGLAADAFDVRSDNDRVRILNRAGALLFDMDDRRAGELGGWQLRRLGDQAPRANAPAFCRSGEGHPVQGRQWCIDKGFGLGSRQGTIWSRGGIGDIIFRNPDTRTRLDRGGLIGVLGDIVLGRLALQAVSLGYDQPLTGYWVAQPEGPRLLRVRSGEYEVAEFHDADRDNRVEVLYVVQPVW